MSDIKKATQFSDVDHKGRRIVTFLTDPKAIKAKEAEIKKKLLQKTQEETIEEKLQALALREVQLQEAELKAKASAEREAELDAKLKELEAREKEIKALEAKAKK